MLKVYSLHLTSINGIYILQAKEQGNLVPKILLLVFFLGKTMVVWHFLHKTTKLFQHCSTLQPHL